MISFGPIPSRRLGKSLGINNIVSPKICSYACIYCQVGNTSRKSAERESFFEPELIFRNVEEHLKKLKKENYPDYLTFVSNGEPTLDINLGKTILLLKKTGIKIAVITNSSLLYNKSVREELCLADWVSVKTDACNNETWQEINRPVTGLNFSNTIDSIIKFSAEFKGVLCTETMLVSDINDTQENFTGLAEIISKIKPFKAYLAIPTRPAAVTSVQPADPDKLNMAWQIFNEMNIDTEFLTGFEGNQTGFTGNIYSDILNITAVHPLREDSLLNLLMNDKADFEVVRSLLKQRLIRSSNYNGKKFYLREYHHQI